jgi:hypothetical protein
MLNCSLIPAQKARITLAEAFNKPLEIERALAFSLTESKDWQPVSHLNAPLPRSC